MARFPELARDQMTDAQKRAYDGIVSGPRGGARGPFNVLLRSPELADTVQRVGAHLRFNSSLPARLNDRRRRDTVAGGCVVALVRAV
jgi:4-carboxymuconolactone decarboxylase